MKNGYSICLNEWALDKTIQSEIQLLLIISSLTAEKGYCFASNKYLADLFEVSEVTISRKIKKLERKGYVKIKYETRGAEILKREIRLSKLITDDYQNRQPTINRIDKENNTSNKNTSFNREVISTYESILDLFPEHLKPQTERLSNEWKSCVDKLLRIDKIPADTLILIVRCAREDSFWSKNFNSVLKLRRKNKDKIPYVVYFYDKFCRSQAEEKKKETLINNIKSWGN